MEETDPNFLSFDKRAGKPPSDNQQVYNAVSSLSTLVKNIRDYSSLLAIDVCFTLGVRPIEGVYVCTLTKPE